MIDGVSLLYPLWFQFSQMVGATCHDTSLIRWCAHTFARILQFAPIVQFRNTNEAQGTL
jgi:hypothetical protein